MLTVILQQTHLCKAQQVSTYFVSLGVAEAKFFPGMGTKRK